MRTRLEAASGKFHPEWQVLVCDLNARFQRESC
jgi:hypothetical protein